MIVVSHEFFGSEQISPPLISKLPGDDGLEIQRQPFGLAASRKVCGVTDAPEEVDSARCRPSFGLRNDVVVTQFVQRPASVPCIADPECGVKIANAARTLLDVWLL